MAEGSITLPGTPLPRRSTVVTVGTFDGVHRGHRVVLDELIAIGRQRNKHSLVVTFDPHPLVVVRPESAPQLLCTASEKAVLLRTAGVDHVAVVPFTRELAEFSPRRFVEEILIGHFGLDHLVIGYDHGFGKGRSGDVATLLQIGRDLNFELTVVPHSDLGDSPISSTRIRTLLQAGDVRAAAEALGRAYSLEGVVVRGDGRGKALGFPTANLRIDPEKLLPAEGIYAVRVSQQREQQGQERQGQRQGQGQGQGSQPRDYDAVLHLGERPTFPEAAASVEVYLLDFKGDLYGQQLQVHFCDRIRGIERFEDADALVAAMRADVTAATRMLAQRASQCG